MLRELIKKLKSCKEKIQILQNNDSFNNTISDNEVLDTPPNFTITIEENNGVYKIEISDYLKSGDFEDIMKELGAYYIADKISICVLWNSMKQRIQKGTFYVIDKCDKIFSIFLDEDDIRIDVKVKQGEITEEKILSYSKGTKEYRVTSFKHDKIGSIFFNKYYPGIGVPEGLRLSTEECIQDVTEILNELEMIEDIHSILNLDLLEHIIADLKNSRLEQEPPKHLAKELTNHIEE